MRTQKIHFYIYGQKVKCGFRVFDLFYTNRWTKVTCKICLKRRGIISRSQARRLEAQESK